MSWEYMSLKVAQKLADLGKENKKLQQRIDKAIEYIKNNIAEEHYAIDFGLGKSRKWFNGDYNKILKILEGENEQKFFDRENN